MSKEVTSGGWSDFIGRMTEEILAGIDKGEFRKAVALALIKAYRWEMKDKTGKDKP